MNLHLRAPCAAVLCAAVLAAGGLGNLYFDDTTATVEVFGTDISSKAANTGGKGDASAMSAAMDRQILAIAEGWRPR